MINGNSLRYILILTNHSSGISQVCNMTDFLVLVLANKYKATCWSSFRRVDVRNLLIDPSADVDEQLLDIETFFEVFFLEYLCCDSCTCGRLVLQYSDTSAPPCPSKIAKRPKFFPMIPSSAIKSVMISINTVFHFRSIWAIFVLSISVLFYAAGIFNVNLCYSHSSV
jgi:hypothetical protein